VFRDGTCNPGPPPSYCRLAAVSFGRDLPFRAAHVCNRLVSGSFHPPSGVLFSFPSPYWCAIGLETYLVLEVGDSQLPAPKPGYGTLGLQPNSFRLTPTGLSPSLAGHSRPLRFNRRRGGRAHNSTSPKGFPSGFGLDSSLFARRYSGNPSWFLFLPLLRCFRSGGSHSLPGALRLSEESRSRRSHSGIPGSTAACAYPGLFRGLPRPSSALKPSHPPDGVACRALVGVCLAFACWLMCG